MSLVARRPRTIAAIVTTALIALSAALLPAGAANAYTQPTSGSPGAAVGYKVQGLHYNACAGLSYTCYNPEVFVPQPYVYRSPATSGTQVVLLVNTLYRWNGSAWGEYTHQSGTFTIGSGVSGRAGLSSDFRLNKTGSYYVVTSLVWLSSTGTNLGSRDLRFIQSGDYQCVGRFTASCSATGSVYLRSPGV